METRPFGKTGMQVGVLGLGGAEIGFENPSARNVDAILGVARDVGLNVIDTAAMYADSEEKIGRALRGRRNQYLLFTKCGRAFPSRLSLAGLRERAYRQLRRWSRGQGEHDSSEWHPRVLQSNIDQSLRRLRTDWIDLIQLHSCSEQILRRGEVIDVLWRARQAGKVRHIGYSGDGEAALYALRCDQFESLQISINVADQEALDVAVPLALNGGKGVIAKRPIANGLWRNTHRPDSSHYQTYWDRLQKLRYHFLQDGSAFEVALRFTLSASVHTAIVGTTNPAHLRQNAQFAAAGVLADVQFEEIRGWWKRHAQPDWVGQM